MPKRGKSGTKRKRFRRGEAREIVKEALAQGYSKRRKILEYIRNNKGIEMNPRTFTEAVNDLINKGIALRLNRGEYMLIWHISLENAVKRIKKALQTLAQSYRIVTLKDVATESGVPPSWKGKVGATDVTFEEMVYGLAVKFEVKIGPERKTRKVIAPAWEAETENLGQQTNRH